MAMATSLKEMMQAANLAVPRLSPAELASAMKAGDALIVDVRDEPEIRQSGKVKGALAVSRGMLEFRADPEMPSHNPAFRKERKVVVYCGSGGRSALAGKTLKDLGYQAVFNAGGFKELAEAGIETEPA
jgi:rhodanese-related sulfurtransferase